MGTGSFLGVKSGRGVTLTLHPLLVPWSRNSKAILLLPLWAVRPVQSLSGCTRVHFTFTLSSVLRNNNSPPVHTSPCTGRLESRNNIPLTDIRVYLVFHFPFFILPSVFPQFLPRHSINIFFKLLWSSFIVTAVLLCY